MPHYKNTRCQGDAGVGSAIEYFSSQGIPISIPFGDSQRYDLVAELDGLKRVQVKNSSSNIVELRTKGGNTSRETIKTLDKDEIDYLFCLTSVGRFLIPMDDFNCKSKVNLPGRYAKYQI